jgi:hypothetical protein
LQTPEDAFGRWHKLDEYKRVIKITATYMLTANFDLSNPFTFVLAQVTPLNPLVL